jgi:hypothetical protein
MQSQYNAAWLESMIPRGDTQPIRVKMKAYIYPSCEVYWDLVRFYDVLYIGRAGVRVAREAVIDSALCQRFAAHMGIQLQGAFMETQRQALAKNREINEFNRQEYTVSTIGVVVMLLAWTVFKRDKRDRRLAQSALECFLLECAVAAQFLEDRGVGR